MSFGRLGSMGRGFGKLGSGKGGGSVRNTLAAGAGSYLWTGQDAALTLRRLAAGAGSYSWSGDDMTPVVNHALPAAAGSYAWTGQDATLTAPQTYTGPLDIASGAVVAYGLRALSAARIGSNVIDIKRASDNTTQTFISLADGSLDIASITTFLNATTGVVTKWYDQSGNGNDATGTGTPLPAFTISATGLGTKPAITFDGTTSSQGFSTGSITAGQPFFVSGVANRTGNTANFTSIITVAAGSPGLLFTNSTNSMTIFGGSLGGFTVADSAWHAIGALFNDTSSQGYVNGTGSGAVTAGSAGFSSAAIIGPFAGAAFAGDLCEVIVWASDKSANAAALSTNQRSSSGYSF